MTPGHFEDRRPTTWARIVGEYRGNSGQSRDITDALLRFSFAMTTSEVRHTEIKHAFLMHNADAIRTLAGTDRGAVTTYYTGHD